MSTDDEYEVVATKGGRRGKKFFAGNTLDEAREKAKQTLMGSDTPIEFGAVEIYHNTSDYNLRGWVKNRDELGTPLPVEPFREPMCLDAGQIRIEVRR